MARFAATSAPRAPPRRNTRHLRARSPDVRVGPSVLTGPAPGFPGLPGWVLQNSRNAYEMSSYRPVGARGHPRAGPGWRDVQRASRVVPRPSPRRGRDAQCERYPTRTRSRPTHRRRRILCEKAHAAPRVQRPTKSTSRNTHSSARRIACYGTAGGAAGRSGEAGRVCPHLPEFGQPVQDSPSPNDPLPVTNVTSSCADRVVTRMSAFVGASFVRGVSLPAPCASRCEPCHVHVIMTPL